MENASPGDEDCMEAAMAGDAPGYKVGDKVQRRDGRNLWGTGFVTQVRPDLLVTASGTDPSAEGFVWDEVRAISEGEVEDGHEMTQESEQECAASEDWADEQACGRHGVRRRGKRELRNHRDRRHRRQQSTAAPSPR